MSIKTRTGRLQSCCPCCGKDHDGPEDICQSCARRRTKEAAEWDAWEQAQGPEYWQAKNLGAPIERERSPLEVRRAQATRQTQQYRFYVFARDGHKCRICGSTNNLVLDHVIPISKGGSDEPANLQTLCRTCNSRKGAR